MGILSIFTIIKYKRLSKMIKAYIPEAKTKQHKANIRGLWSSPKSGVCYDYLHKAKIEVEALPYIKKHYKQEAIFYTYRRKAYIWHNPKKIEALRYQTYYAYDKGTRGLKDYLKGLLRQYGGITVYIRQENYLIEVWN